MKMFEMDQDYFTVPHHFGAKIHSHNAGVDEDGFWARSSLGCGPPCPRKAAGSDGPPEQQSTSEVMDLGAPCSQLTGELGLESPLELQVVQKLVEVVAGCVVGVEVRFGVQSHLATVRRRLRGHGNSVAWRG